MIERYGNELEADLLERFNLDMVDFHRPWGDPKRQSRSRLASLVQILDRRSDSYLSWARSRDVEVYRQARDSGRLKTGSGRPQAFEVSLEAQILMGAYQELKKLTHVHYSPRGRAFTDKGWPRPETAFDLLRREEADEGYNQLMSEIVHVEQEEFERIIAEHQAQQNMLRIERE